MIFVLLRDSVVVFFVMTIYFLAYVWHTRITEVCCAFVENIYKFVIWWKVFNELLFNLMNNHRCWFFIDLLYGGLNQMLRFLFTVLIPFTKC